MKLTGKSLCIALCGATTFVACPAKAKLGETVPQLTKRFGRAYESKPQEGGGVAYSFHIKGCDVEAVVKNGKSVEERYYSFEPLGPNEQPPAKIVRGILETNAPGAKWKDAEPEGRKEEAAFVTADGKYRAGIYLSLYHPGPTVDSTFAVLIEKTEETAGSDQSAPAESSNQAPAISSPSLASTSAALSAQSPVSIGTTNDGRSTVTITVPLSEDEDDMSAMFDFGQTKGFLGPSSNPSDQSGFSNADKTIIAVNHQPVTKSSYVHLFLRLNNGNIVFLNNVNTQVARLLTGKWAETAKTFLRVESISDRNIAFETVDFDVPNREEHRFTLTFSRDGTFLAAQNSQPAITPSPQGVAPKESLTLVPASGSLSRAEWRARLKRFCTIPSGHQLISTQKRLFAVMGKPDDVQHEGRSTYWYYKCSDGIVQLAFQLDPEMMGGQIIAEVSDE